MNIEYRILNIGKPKNGPVHIPYSTFHILFCSISFFLILDKKEAWRNSSPTPYSFSILLPFIIREHSAEERELTEKIPR